MKYFTVVFLMSGHLWTEANPAIFQGNFFQYNCTLIFLLPFHLSASDFSETPKLNFHQLWSRQYTLDHDGLDQWTIRRQPVAFDNADIDENKTDKVLMLTPMGRHCLQL